MLFRRVFLCALFVGVLAGSLLTAVQHLQVLPLIAAAERFEQAGEAAVAAPHALASGHDHGAHGHTHEPSDGAPWGPADGMERNFWTLAANIATAIGLALLLLPAMAVWDARAPAPRASWRRGLLWGAAGYLSFFALPSLGLPPEIPGAAAASLYDRQAWWIGTVACTVLALAAVALTASRWRWLALVLPVLPFLIGAPDLGIDPFAGFAPDIAAQMHALAREFVVATALAIGAYWLALGATAGVAVRRWLRPVFLATLHGTPAPGLRPSSRN